MNEEEGYKGFWMYFGKALFVLAALSVMVLVVFFIYILIMVFQYAPYYGD